ncbi:MAG: ABC transporter permease, partial [Nitrospinaceae bacterium]|nr:ABC transporter permease [Nitrospinaceae bacterium]NIS84675.1 ABC transporter permease [Nitrospinaceae bacterium]NIX33878.1 ABC transporter permease [Nitrospinaceae bacterium]
MISRFIYLLRRALKNMRQSLFLCTAAIGTVTVSLCILTFFAIIVLNVQQLTQHWSREVEVVAYLDDVPAGKQLQTLIDDAQGIAEVEEVKYITRQQAFENFRERLGDDAVLLEGLKEDFLPASLRMSLHESSRTRAGVDRVVSQLKKKKTFSDFRYGQDWLERFEAFVGLIKMAGAILGGFLLFATLFIVSNTIKLTVYARRDELEVMSLVGGTSLFIKTPFLIEGGLQGAIGGCMALGLSYLLYALFLHQGLATLLLSTGVESV